jgi:GNAT superfamily N-acetyltransferase
MHRESSYSFLPYSRSKVHALILAYLKERSSRCLLVAESGGAIVGMIAGVLIEYYFCDETLVADEALFVSRSHRGGAVAIRLIRAMEQWAFEKGARELCLSISTNVCPQMTGQFYERLGFTPMGGVYKKRMCEARVIGP